MDVLPVVSIGMLNGSIYDEDYDDDDDNYGL